MKRALLVFWVGLGYVSFCLSATYYVDRTNGHDTNPGTSNEPWMTLTRTRTFYSGSGPKVQEGDTVILRDGSYGAYTEEDISRNDWVTYKADIGYTPILTNISHFPQVKNTLFYDFICQRSIYKLSTFQ